MWSSVIFVVARTSFSPVMLSRMPLRGTGIIITAAARNSRGASLPFGQARRRDVDGFLEVRTVQRIGLVENGEDAQGTVSDQAFYRHFFARYEAFDDDLIEMRLAGRGDFWRSQ